jgi:hypothetical protein
MKMSRYIASRIGRDKGDFEVQTFRSGGPGGHGGKGGQK